MGFAFKCGETVPDGVLRIVREQLDKAAAELSGSDAERAEAIHQARKRFKKLRAVLRLVRGSLGEQYALENARFRDLGRKLSVSRDVTAVLESFDALQERVSQQLSPAALQELRQFLTERRDRALGEQANLDEKVGAVLAEIGNARAALEHWRLPEDSFDLLAPGFGKTYGRGRDARKRAAKRARDEDYHDWRKRVKYHWYHIRMLRDVWTGPLKVRASELETLSDLLGDDHDLVVLRGLLVQEEPGNAQERELLSALIRQRQVELRGQAHPLGQRLYAERPREAVERLRSYWEVWKQRSLPDVLLDESFVQDSAR